MDTGLPDFGGSSINIAMITDGTSNTAAFSERVKAIGNNFTGTSAPFDPGKPTASLATPAAVANNLEATPQPYYQVCIGDPARAGQRRPGRGEFQRRQHLGGDVGLGPAGLARGTSTSCRRTPGAAVRGSRSPTWPTAITPAASTSLFCDGSVKFIKSSISLNAWWALGSRAGGEVVSSDAY